MKIIYIAGAYRGDNAWEVTQNVNAAECVAWDVARRGYMPLCPHTNTRNFDGTLTPEFWLEGTLELMRRCDAVVLVPGWKMSQGTHGEIAEAKRLGIPVYYTPMDLPQSEYLQEKMEP